MPSRAEDDGVDVPHDLVQVLAPEFGLGANPGHHLLAGTRSKAVYVDGQGEYFCAKSAARSVRVNKHFWRLAYFRRKSRPRSESGVSKGRTSAAKVELPPGAWIQCTSMLAFRSRCRTSDLIICFQLFHKSQPCQVLEVA